VGNLIPFGGLGGPADIPTLAVYGPIALGAFGLVAAFGVWRMRRWGAIVSGIVAVLCALLAAPGLLFAPALALQALCAFQLALTVAIVAVLIAGRRAYA
jgi:hypothetical protein